MRDKAIHVEGARTHNLKGVSCDIPHGRLTVVTGVSGSGKSTLAFDTLYAEGQRRFVESLSAYARQYLPKIPRPAYEKMTNLPPAIAIEQKNHVRNARSTVGTLTEIHDYLRLLFAKFGQVLCEKCQTPVVREHPQSIREKIVLESNEQTLLIGFSLNNLDSSEVRTQFLDLGFRRVVVCEKKKFRVCNLETDSFPRQKWVGVVCDRIAISSENQKRLLESIEAALSKGGGPNTGEVWTLQVNDIMPEKSRRVYYAGRRCSTCGLESFEPKPAHFSFNHPLGLCLTCEGYGRTSGVDLERVIPDQRKTLYEGAIDPFTKPAFVEWQERLRDFCKKFSIPMNRGFKDLKKDQQEIVIEGRGEWEGVVGFFKALEKKRYKPHVRIFLARYRGYTVCGSCLGNRLSKKSLNVLILGKTIADLLAMPVSDLKNFIEQVTQAHREVQGAQVIVKEIRSRLRYLLDVGVGYLSLARTARTLSGGESQRIALASALGAGLTETLYVLDEPTIGLHPRDHARLLKIILELRNLGNTLVVVEHDRTFIESADHILDIGPKAGSEGGELVFAGSFADLVKSQTSLTAEYLRKKTPVITKREQPDGFIVLDRMTLHNLNDLSVRIPLGVMVGICGVSGAGKTTLIHHALHPAFEAWKKAVRLQSLGPHFEADGFEQIADIILMSQDDLGRSSRSNLATVLDIYSPIRAIFSTLQAAKRTNLKPGDFSFNVPGGRCEVCKGAGSVVVEMQFLEDIEVICEACQGLRFTPKVLAIQFHGKNIVDVLKMTVLEAKLFFGLHREVQSRLSTLEEVGLGYLTLGQSTATLSGGELQRLKLAKFLIEDPRDGKGLAGQAKKKVFIFDEPSTGLHLADIARLIEIFRRLVNHGHSVVMIEHQLDLIYACDTLIEMGPDGGSLGGHVVAMGTPEQVMSNLKSITGRYLHQYVSH